MQEQVTIYPAAALFNGRETSFNLELVSRLERKGHKALFPQRDGFEFGRLANALERKVSQDQLGSAVQQVIYLLDMGIFLPQSDVVVANLDEPQDEGVMVEMSYAKLMSKFVVGYRTDVRTPYSTINNALGGIHFFPAFQCDYFVRSYLPCRTEEERKQGLDRLAGTIAEIIKKEKVQRRGLPNYASENPNIQRITEGAELLFSGIQDIHSEEELKEISERYSKNQESLKKVYPTIISA